MFLVQSAGQFVHTVKTLIFHYDLTSNWDHPFWIKIHPAEKKIISNLSINYTVRKFSMAHCSKMHYLLYCNKMLVREPVKLVDYLAFLTGEFCCKQHYHYLLKKSTPQRRSCRLQNEQGIL